MMETEIFKKNISENTLIETLSKVTDCAAYTEQLCAPLKTEDYIPQPAEFVSPPKWHLGHTNWFIEKFILEPFFKNYKLFNPKFHEVFNSYYISAGKRIDRNHRGSLARPTVKEVYAYRKYVRSHLEVIFENTSKNNFNEIYFRLLLGLNHEQQHQELLITDIKYTFAQNPLFPIYASINMFDKIALPESKLEMLDMKAGVYKIGFRGSGFCYDNELSAHDVCLNSFKIASRPIINKEYMAFIEDGGYQKFEFWHDEAWKWINENKINHPLYWMKGISNWKHFTLQGIMPIEEQDLLKHVSYYESAAFAQWKGLRLPTEFEWEAAAKHFNWGHRWEWTNSAYLPYPGFKPMEGGLGEYNGKFMISQMVLRGSSTATPKGHSRISYRNFFYPQQRWQFTGIRLAE